MTATQKILAFDLGAESGRALVGRFDGSRLELDVVHRFATGGVHTLDTLHWDVLGLWREMLDGCRKAAADFGPLASLGVDTWGVDVAFLGRDGQLLGNPRHYRDPHTENIMEAAFARTPRAEIFRQTGIQFMRFNTLFQLLAFQRDRSPLLENARSMLFIPDLFHYWFTGVKVNEYTDASTSQMIDPHARTWARDLVRSFQLPENILGTLVPPGTLLGPVHSSLVSQMGLPAIPVIAPATHDTAAAVAAVPARGDSWAYISSGTWSLVGAETRQPCTDAKALAANVTNEGGVDGTIRLLKNVMGLWLVQECRRAWIRQGTDYSYETLMHLAQAAPPFVSLIDPDDAGFILPTSMPQAIVDYCKKKNQTAPSEPGPTIRCALESLAMKYRWVLEKLEGLIGRKLAVIHVVGGGSQNTLLCQLTADCCNRPVIAGPVEATAVGNVLTQAMGLKLLSNLAEAREVVRRSFAPQSFDPHNPQAWQEPYQRFLQYLPNP
jgi:rhamnulokinase